MEITITDEQLERWRVSVQVHAETEQERGFQAGVEWAQDSLHAGELLRLARRAARIGTSPEAWTAETFAACVGESPEIFWQPEMEKGEDWQDYCTPVFVAGYVRGVLAVLKKLEERP